MTSAEGRAPRAEPAGAPEDERTVTMVRSTLPADDEAPAADGAEREQRPARREPLLLQGSWPGLLASALTLAVVLGTVPFALALLVVQVLLVLGLLALLDAPAAGGAFVVAAVSCAAADVVVLVTGGVAGIAGVVGLTLLGALLHQLSRSRRSRVTESLADTLLVTVAGVAASCLLVLDRLDGGHQPLLVALVATGSTLLVARCVDAVLARPRLAPAATRGWPGLVAGLAAGVGAAVALSGLTGPTAVAGPPVAMLELTAGSAALIGLVVAVTAATADLVIDLGAAELKRGWRDARRATALRPTGLLLPFALVGPVALLAGRLVLP